MKQLLPPSGLAILQETAERLRPGLVDIYDRNNQLILRATHEEAFKILTSSRFSAEAVGRRTIKFIRVQVEGPSYQDKSCRAEDTRTFRRIDRTDARATHRPKSCDAFGSGTQLDRKAFP